MFQNSPSKGKDPANYELKYSEPGASCSNELVDSSNIISYTTEGDNASPKKIYWDSSFDWRTLFNTKKPESKYGVSENSIWQKKVDHLMLISTASFSGFV